MRGARRKRQEKRNDNRSRPIPALSDRAEPSFIVHITTYLLLCYDLSKNNITLILYVLVFCGKRPSALFRNIERHRRHRAGSSGIAENRKRETDNHLEIRDRSFELLDSRLQASAFRSRSMPLVPARSYPGIPRATSGHSLRTLLSLVLSISPRKRASQT